jgi:hypothetical protein
MATSTRTTESATVRHQVPDELGERFFALRGCARLLTELNSPTFADDFSTVQFAMRFKYLTARMSELVEQLGREIASGSGVASDNSAADTTAVVSFIARLSESLKRTLH